MTRRPRARRRVAAAWASRSPSWSCSIVGGLYLVLVADGIYGNGGKQLTTLSPHGVESQKIQTLITPVFAIAGVVFVLRLRRRPRLLPEVPRPRRRRRGVPGPAPRQHPARDRLDHPAGPDPAGRGGLHRGHDREPQPHRRRRALQVEVSGQQWWWEFHYDMNNDGVYTDTKHGDIITANELVIPVHREVEPARSPRRTSSTRSGSRRSTARRTRCRVAPPADRSRPTSPACTTASAPSSAGSPTPTCACSCGSCPPRTSTTWVANQQKPSVTPTSRRGQRRPDALRAAAAARVPPDQRRQRRQDRQPARPSKELVYGRGPQPHPPRDPRHVRRAIYNLYTPDSLTDPARQATRPSSPTPAIRAARSTAATARPTRGTSPASTAWLRNPPPMKPMYPARAVRRRACAAACRTST